MIRVTVTGSECTGKTTLARALAGHYGTAVVPEAARRWVEHAARPPVWRDVDAIAREHTGLADEARERARRLLVLDTDLLSTVVYSRHYYGRCPDWVTAAAREHAADLYLLADTDVPWVADGPFRDRGDRREEMQALFRAELEARRLPFVMVSGPHEARMRTAIDAIDCLLAVTS